MLPTMADMSSPDTDEEIETLKAEASARWGDKWTLRVQHFSDGDSNAFAFHSRGRDEDGHLVHDQLFILDSSEVVVERTTMESRDLYTETIEAPAASV